MAIAAAKKDRRFAGGASGLFIETGGDVGVMQ
jgi:hypothetical protein